jgi:putative membrane protein
MGFLLRMALTALGLWLAASWVYGVHFDDNATLLLAALLLGLVNAVVRPVLIFMTLPITLLSLGLFLWVINGAMISLVAWMLGGFWVDGLWSAMLGSLIVGLTGWVGNAFIGPSGRYEIVVAERDGRIGPG